MGAPKLLGTYTSPAVTVGDEVECALRGIALVTGWADAPIPWPVGRRPGRGATRPILFAGLAEAVRRESAAAVCHWWGVTPQTVTKWRRAIHAGQYTEGTRRAKAAGAAASPGIAAALAKAHAKAGDADRRARIAAAKRGNARPPEVIAAMNAGRRMPRAAGE